MSALASVLNASIPLLPVLHGAPEWRMDLLRDGIISPPFKTPHFIQYGMRACVRAQTSQENDCGQRGQREAQGDSHFHYSE